MTILGKAEHSYVVSLLYSLLYSITYSSPAKPDDPFSPFKTYNVKYKHYKRILHQQRTKLNHTLKSQNQI